MKLGRALGDARVAELVGALSRFAGLRRLVLADNALAQVPDPLAALAPSLESLDLRDNRIGTLPRALRRFAALRILDVAAGTSVGDVIDDVAEVTSIDGTTALAYVKRRSDFGRIPAHSV